MINMCKDYTAEKARKAQNDVEFAFKDYQNGYELEALTILKAAHQQANSLVREIEKGIRGLEKELKNDN